MFWAKRLGAGFNRAVSSRKGFTIVELMVVLALLCVVLVIIFNIHRFAEQSWAWSTAESRALQDARLTVQRMEKEIRQARIATSGEAAVVQIFESELRIYTDVSGDGIPELVEYALDESGSLRRRVREATNDAFPYNYDDPAVLDEIVIERVNNTVLFDVGEVADGDSRRRVVISITIEESAGVTPLELQSTVISRSREASN